jgi:hypothetical protein
MFMHLIRLRAGWVEPGASPPGRVTLPVPIGQAVPALLERSFQPPRLGQGERLSLELRDVPGLTRVELDEAVVVDGPEAEAGGRFPLPGPLPRRMVLRLTVDGPVGAGPASGWGSIALRVDGAADANG